MPEETKTNEQEKSPNDKPWQFKPGQVANPAGRPKGSRNRLGEQFIADLYEDWKDWGLKVIADVRESRPHEYLKVMASILPKELHIKETSVEDLSDHELSDAITTIRSNLIASTGKASKPRARKAPSPQEAEPTGRPN